MSTHLPSLQSDDLLARCREATGADFSAVQLAHWVKMGLLPTAHRGGGKGQGRGSKAWLWDAECLPRLVLIAQSRPTGKKNVSILQAARGLAVKGYVLRSDLLREVLLDFVGDVDREAGHKRRSLRKRPSPKEKVHGDPDLPTSLHGKGTETTPDTLALARAHLTLDGQRAAIRAIDDDALQQVYQQAGAFLAVARPLARLSLEHLLSRAPASPGTAPDIGTNYADQLPPAIGVNESDALRLPTVVLFVIDHQRDGKLQSAMEGMVRLAGGLFASLDMATEEAHPREVSPGKSSGEASAATHL
jgi:hypothetical protein